MREAADEIGVSTRMVRFLLSGARCPSPATCVALEEWSRGRIKAPSAALLVVRDPAPPHHPGDEVAEGSAAKADDDEAAAA